MTTKMEKPTVEAVRFQSTDVIATSGERGVMLGGFNDEESGNWFVSGTKGATEGTRVTDTVLGYFKTASGVEGSEYNNWKFKNDDEGACETFNRLVSRDNNGSSVPLDGWYTWCSTGSGLGYFQWQSLN